MDPILSTFCRSRSWTKAQLRSLKRAQAYALRRAFGVDRFSMQEEHISDKMLFQAQIGNRLILLYSGGAGHG